MDSLSCAPFGVGTDLRWLIYAFISLIFYQYFCGKKFGKIGNPISTDDKPNEFRFQKRIQKRKKKHERIDWGYFQDYYWNETMPFFTKHMCTYTNIDWHYRWKRTRERNLKDEEQILRRTFSRMNLLAVQKTRQRNLPQW